MADTQKENQTAGPTPLGIYDRPKRASVTGIEIAAVALTVVWLGLSLTYFMTMPDSATENTDGQSNLLMAGYAELLPRFLHP